MMEYDSLLRLLGARGRPARFRKLLCTELEECGCRLNADSLIVVLPNPLEICCGLLKLVEGPMRSRLAVAFSILDEDDDGRLSRRELWRLFRSLLVVDHLLVLEAAADDDDDDESRRIRRHADAAAVQLVAQVVGSAGASVDITELQTWCDRQAGASALGAGLHATAKLFQGGFSSDEHSAAGAGSEVVFSGHFYDAELLLSVADAAAMRAVAEAGFADADILETTHLLHCLKSPEGLVTRRAFHSFVSALLDEPARNISDRVAYLLFGDSSEESQLPFPSLAAGLTVLCGGSKSAKLRLGFELFDEDGDGVLDEAQLSTFLSAYLHVLVRASSQSSGSGWAGDACDAAAADMVSDCGAPALSFAAFSEYYNCGGYRALGWIELIDLRKWAGIKGAAMADLAEPAFELTLRLDERRSITRPVPRRAAQRLYFAASQSGLYEVPIDRVYAALCVVAEDGLVARTAFIEAVVLALPPPPHKSPGSLGELESYLEVVFLCMDSTGEGYADLAALTCGVCVLCRGNKSDKLALCFELVASSSGGVLTRRGIYQLLRSLFWAIWSLALCDEDGATPAQTESLYLDATVLVLCDDILSSGAAVDLDAIAAWYAHTGFRLAPWLELLDMSKWRFLATSA